MLNFISSTYSIHISLLTALFFTSVFCTYCSKPTHLFCCSFVSDEGHHTYVTLRQPLSCLPRQTDKLEVNNKLSKANKFKSHQSSKPHYSINIAVRVTTNCVHSPWVQQPMLAPSCLVWPSLWISTVTLMPKWPSEASKASKAAGIFSWISPGCHCICMTLSGKAGTFRTSLTF